MSAYIKNLALPLVPRLTEASGVYTISSVPRVDGDEVNVGEVRLILF